MPEDPTVTQPGADLSNLLERGAVNELHEDLMPGTFVEVLTKQQTDGENCYGTIIGAAPNAPDTYVVEYHPGLDNGHHAGNELRVVDKLPDVA